MKSIKKLVAIFALCCLCLSIAGCSTASVEQFASDAAGTWHRHGNLQDVMIEVQSDGTWSYKGFDNGEWVTMGVGTIVYNQDYKSFEFINDMSTSVNMVGLDKDGALTFASGFYRAELSIDGFDQYDGDWYLDGDKDKNYFSLEGGEWSFSEAQDTGHVSVDSGYLVWDGKKNELVARKSPDEAPFAVFTVGDDSELKKGVESYIRAENPADAGDLDDSGSGDADQNANENPPLILFDTNYYLDGDVESPAWCFSADGQAEFNYETTNIKYTYTIQEQQITISSGGETMNELEIIDNNNLVDLKSGDIYIR